MTTGTSGNDGGRHDSNRRRIFKLDGAVSVAGTSGQEKFHAPGGLIAAVLLALTFSSAPLAWADPVPGGSLDPTTIPKYRSSLTIPPAMPKTSVLRGGIDYYEIAVRQFQQQVLPAGMPKTTVWSYGSVNHSGTFNYPAWTIEAEVDRPVRVKWINDLKDPATGKFLPHLLPVDQTYHWANPAKDCIDGSRQTDCRGKSQAAYTGPVPIITHLHGAHVNPDSDGYPEALYLPGANNITDHTY